MIATICSSVNRPFRIAPSESGASLSTIRRSENPGAGQGRKRESLRYTAVQMFEQYFRDRILPFDLNAAQPYANIVAGRQKVGRPIDELDAQIASIAAYRTMAVATRDTAGFDN